MPYSSHPHLRFLRETKAPLAVLLQMLLLPELKYQGTFIIQTETLLRIREGYSKSSEPLVTDISGD